MVVSFLHAAFAAPLSFEDAIDRALDAPAGRAVIATSVAERAGSRDALAWDANPELAYETAPDETVALVEVPVDLAGPAKIAALGPTNKALEERARIARTSVGIAAGAAWLDARRAEDDVAVAEVLERLGTRAIEVADVRARAGELGSVDRVLLGGDGVRALSLARQLRQAELTSQARLAALLGLEPPIDLAAWTAVAEAPPIELSSLPAVIGASLESRAALARRHAAAWGLLPELTLTAGWKTADTTGPVWGAALEVPLFAPGLARLRAARGEADVAAATAELERANGRTLLAEAMAELESSRASVESWSRIDVREALDALVREVEAGERPAAEMLVRRKEVTDLVLDSIEARWRLERARLALWELAGRLPTEGR